MRDEPDSLTDPFSGVPSIVDEAIVTLDRGGVITDWNIAAELTFGWTFQELSGRMLVDALVPDWARAEYGPRLSVDGDLGAVGIGRRVQFPAVDREGRERYLTFTPITRTDDTTTHFRALLHDVTEQVSAETDARWLSDAINGASVAMYTVDVDGVIRSLNPICEMLIGLSAGSVIGRSIIDLTPDEHRRAAMEQFEAIKRGETVPDRARWFDRPDGQRIHLLVNGGPIRSPEGRFRGVCYVLSDITAQVARDHAFQARLEEMQRRSMHSRALRIQGDLPALQPGPRDVLVRQTLQRAREALGVDIAWTAVQEGAVVRLEAVDGAAELLPPPGNTAPVEQSYLRQITQGQAAAVVLRDPSETAMPSRRSELRNYLGVPILRHDASSAGVLCVANRSAERDLGLQQVEQLQRFAASLGRALDLEESRAATQGMTPRLIAVEALLGALVARDEEATASSRSVVALALGVAARLGVDVAEREQVECVALLHDIGKLGIPDHVLQKPDPLTLVEWELMREVPAIGERIVAGIAPLADVAPAIRGEHERWDGTGYPDGLAGNSIPLAARIALVCHAWQALRSPRAYRPAHGREVAYDHEAAVLELHANAGTQFDPDVVDALVAVLAEQAG